MIPNITERLCLLHISIIYPSHFQQKRSLLQYCGCEHVNKHWRLNLPALRVQLGGSIRAEGAMHFQSKALKEGKGHS